MPDPRGHAEYPTFYPEHEKLKKVSEKSQVIGEFIDWLGERDDPIHLAHWVESGRSTVHGPEHELVYARVPINRLLAEFFGIDLDCLEDEKRAMLDDLRRKQAEAEALAEYQANR
jgi:hypothetical protein